VYKGQNAGAEGEVGGRNPEVQENMEEEPLLGGYNWASR
jgi:hypothetical protein